MRSWADRQRSTPPPLAQYIAPFRTSPPPATSIPVYKPALPPPPPFPPSVASSLQAFTAGFTSGATLCWLHTRINFDKGLILMIECVHFLLFLSLYGSHAMYEGEIGKLNFILPISHILFYASVYICRYPVLVIARICSSV
jgi:hypothetical protein